MASETANTRGALTLAQLRQREDILRVAAAHGASNVRVFGSVARGQADASSDVDLLVDITTSADGFAYFGVLEGIRRAIEELIGYNVDVVEIRSPLSPQGQRMADRIRQEAILLGAKSEVVATSATFSRASH